MIAAADLIVLGGIVTKKYIFIFPDDGGESVKLGNTFDLCHLWRNVYASYGD